MQINRATVTRLLKRKPASKEMVDNLYAQVGSGKRKSIHFHFYWTEFGERQYRKIGSANANTP
ncbi:MAG: hypothetical protein AAEI92_01280, partial [Arenicellales bacterium]